MKLSDQTQVAMPIRNIIGIVAAVAIATWAYFGIVERLKKLETTNSLVEKDLDQLYDALSKDIEKNNEFRIKWPRGELGSPPADSEQFMLIEHIAGQVEKLTERIDSMMNNKVNIQRLQDDVKELDASVEKLKDKVRDNGWRKELKPVQ